MRVMFTNIFNNYFREKGTVLKVLLSLSLLAGVLFFPHFAFAYIGEDTINNALLSIGRAFFSAGFWFVQMAVGYTTTVISADGVTAAWTNVRNLSLEIFGIIILVVAFMNLLKIQIQTWGVNRMIPKMFLAVFLIVFSKFLCISLINFSHAIVGSLLGDSGNTAGFFAGFTGLGKSLEGLSGDNISTAMTFVVLIICIISFFVFLVLAVALFFRAAFLAFLIIISPLAFAMTILPWTEKYLQEWVKNFMKWVFFFPICILILWVGMSMVNSVAPDVAPDANTTTFTVSGGTSDATDNFLADWSVMILAFLTIPLAIWFPLKMLGAVGQGIQDRVSGKKGIVGVPFDPKAAKARWDKRGKRIDKKKEQHLGGALGAVGRKTRLSKLGAIGATDGNMNWLGKAALGHDNAYTPEKGTRQGGAARLRSLRDKAGQEGVHISDKDIEHAATGNWSHISSNKARKHLRKFSNQEGRNAIGAYIQHLKNRENKVAVGNILRHAEETRVKAGRYDSLSMAEKVDKTQKKEGATKVIKQVMDENKDD